MLSKYVIKIVLIIKFLFVYEKTRLPLICLDNIAYSNAKCICYAIIYQLCVNKQLCIFKYGF